MPLSDEDDEYLDDFDSSGELTPMSSVPLRGGRRLASVAPGGDAADDGHANDAAPKHCKGQGAPEVAVEL